MRVRIRTRVHTAETIINIEREVLSLRAAKRLFRSLQSAVPDNDLEMVVVRSRREKNGIEAGHRIDRTKHALRATLTGPGAGPILKV